MLSSRRLEEDFFDDDENAKHQRRSSFSHFNPVRNNSASMSRFASKHTKDFEQTSEQSDSNATFEEIGKANPSSFMPAQLRESFEYRPESKESKDSITRSKFVAQKLAQLDINSDAQPFYIENFPATTQAIKHPYFEEVPPVDTDALIRKDSFSRLVKQKVYQFEKKQKETITKDVSPLTNPKKPFEKDIERKIKQNIKFKTQSNFKIRLTTPKEPKMRLTTPTATPKVINEVVPPLDLSIAGSHLGRTGVKFDLKTTEELELCDSARMFENYVTPSHHSQVSLSYKKFTTDQTAQNSQLSMTYKKFGTDQTGYS